MSSGIIYPKPLYIPPLPVFNPIFFPQSFGTTNTSGGGGGQTNIFPNGLTSGNVITMDGGTGGGGGTGVERTITGISYLDFVDSADTNPTNITGYITLNGNTLEIGSSTALSGINVNLLGSVVSANGTPIATGGNVSNNQDNTFQSGFTQTFEGAVEINNTTLSFPGGGTIILGNTTSVLDFPEPLPVVPNSNSGLGITWNNQTGSNGEVDFLCYGQGGSGGFAFYTMNSTTTPTRIATIYQNTSSFTSNPTIPTSTTIGTLTASQTATTYLLNSTYAPLASPTLTGVPIAPTAPFATNTQQLATTAFVQSAIGGASNVLFSITSSAGTGTAPGSWDFTLPNGVYPQQFYYFAYLNLQSGAGTTLGQPIYAPGSTISNGSSNGNNILGFGLAVYTTWNTGPSTFPVVPGYGYFFNNIAGVGATGFIINTISQANNSTGTTDYKIGLSNVGSVATFTIVGLAVP